MKRLSHTIYAESPYNWFNRPNTMDPLSDVLALLKPQACVSGAISLDGDLAVRFPKHAGIKCYAMIAGQCWLVMEGIAEPVRISAGDCFLLPHGRPFCLTTDLSLKPVDFNVQMKLKVQRIVPALDAHRKLMVGGHFILAGNHAGMLLQSLPPVVHIQKESDKEAMRWSLERMSEELYDPQPGGALIAQQLAYMMLIQALRLHVTSGARPGSGWLFALADPQMSAVISAIHTEPGHGWTLQTLAERAGMSRSVFALRFKEFVGVTPMEYLTRWRMMLAADKLMNSSDSISQIARSLGYESESAFGKAFRRALGSSPRKYSRNETSDWAQWQESRAS
jgi:AraC-like DNA-binding protein